MYRFAIIFAIIYTCSVLVVATAVQPENLIVVGEHKYLVVNDKKLSWWRARDYCHEHEMTLLTLDNAEKSKQLNDYLQEADIANGHIYWTSGTDQQQHGHFIWYSTGAEFNYTNWLPGMPDNWRHDEHCVELGFREPGKWNDCRCRHERHFICEQRVHPDEWTV